MTTQEDILNSLERLKQKDRSYFKPADYKKFMPSGIPNLPDKPDQTLYSGMMQAAMDRSMSATQLAMVKAQNRRDYQSMLEAQKRLKRAKHALNNSGDPVGGYSVGGYTPNIPGGKWKDKTPLDLDAGLATTTWNGRSITMNKSVMDNTIAFLNALTRQGYKINSLGTYANRNIAGTNHKSLHSYGLAFDINPAQNPVTYGHIVTNLPKNIGRLAARYGLVWGGNWNGPKYDTMHFSFPAYGTK